MAFYRPNNTIDRNGTQITETDTPNWYSDKSGSYTQIGAIVPTLVNAYTDTTDVPDQSWTSIEYDHHYAQRGFLYCDGGLETSCYCQWCLRSISTQTQVVLL